jgi:nitronate monooxygenase
MAGAQGPELAIAVCRAGGLGSLPSAMLTPDLLREQIAAIRAKTEAPFNVNFFCHAEPAPDKEVEARWRARLAPYYAEAGIGPSGVRAGPARAPFDDAMCAVVEETRPAVVSFHFGLPHSKLLARVKASGALILSSAKLAMPPVEMKSLIQKIVEQMTVAADRIEIWLNRAKVAAALQAGGQSSIPSSCR